MHQRIQAKKMELEDKRLGREEQERIRKMREEEEEEVGKDI
jgi:hypothetical protein